MYIRIFTTICIQSVIKRIYFKLCWRQYLIHICNHYLYYHASPRTKILTWDNITVTAWLHHELLVMKSLCHVADDSYVADNKQLCVLLYIFHHALLLQVYGREPWKEPIKKSTFHESICFSQSLGVLYLVQPHHVSVHATSYLWFSTYNI